MSWIGLMSPPSLRALTRHQLDTLRLYQQLGSYEAVADFRGVQVATVSNTLKIAREKLGVGTTREAIERIESAP